LLSANIEPVMQPGARTALNRKTIKPYKAAR